MKILHDLIISMMIIVIISLLSISLDVAEAEVFTATKVYDNIFINKPKWCNSVSLIDNFIFEEFPQQKEYKYPCATFL